MSALTSIKNTFTQAVTDMMVGINDPDTNSSISEATTGFGFLTAVGVSTFNPVITTAGILGLVACANHARLSGQAILSPTLAKPSV